MLQGLIKTSTELLAFIESKDEAFLQEVLVYKNMKGDPYENVVEEILYHLVNHGSYHRGQLVTMLRGAGVTQLVSTDLIAWFREQRQNKK